jgi:hypothetical protein
LLGQLLEHSEASRRILGNAIAFQKAPANPSLSDGISLLGCLFDPFETFRRISSKPRTTHQRRPELDLSACMFLLS